MTDTSDDPHDLMRFRAAQTPIYPRALQELRNGRKQTHWMWFVFPQAQGLGSSERSIRFAIDSRQEARAYLDDLVLGPRLRECTEAMLSLDADNATRVLGSPDDMKFQSSMTLFDAIEPDTIFGQALDKYFGGKRDPATLAFLGHAQEPRLHP